MNASYIPLKAIAIALAVTAASSSSPKHSSHPKPAHKASARTPAPARPASGVAKPPSAKAGGPGSPGPSPTQDEQRLLPAIHAAGFAGDHTDVPALVASFQTLSSPFFYREPLNALARLGAVEALPAVDAVIEADRDQDTTNFAVAARARLVAEDAVSGLPSGPAKAAKVARFYKELGLTPADLNKAEAWFQPQRLQRLPSGSPVPAPIGADAVQQLADMVYRGNYADYAALPGVSQVDFGPDYGAALKMRLAPLSQQQRISTMIQELANKTTWSLLDNLETQLLVDEGKAAS